MFAGFVQLLVRCSTWMRYKTSAKIHQATKRVVALYIFT